MKNVVKEEKHKTETGTSYLQEYNYISEFERTHFYMTFTTKPIKYGVCINKRDISDMNKIIKFFKQSEKPRLEARRKDLIQTNYIKKITKNNQEKQQEYIELLIKGGDKTQWIKNNK